MKKIPKVLIIGRPNVGKSTLINRITKSRSAITAEISGVTRDVTENKVEWNGKEFHLLDSAGLLLGKRDALLQKRAEEVVLKMMSTCRTILFLGDGQEGVTGADEGIANLIRAHHDKVLVVVNKVDGKEQEVDRMSPFYKLGFGTPVAISAKQGLGVDALLDQLVADLTEKKADQDQDQDLYRVAIVGKPNVGKSSLLNALLNEDRVIVHHEAGTTRDSIEAYYKSEENTYLFIDTAGIRRRGKVKDKIEFYAGVRAQKSIEKADLVVMVLDVSLLITDQDKKIINMVIERHKNLLIFVNKWDTTERTDQMRRDSHQIIVNELPLLEYYPFVFGSAKEKVGLGKLLNQIPDIVQRSMKRIQTSELNEFVEKVIKTTPPPAKKGRSLKLYYATQVEVMAPVFVFFVNHIDLVDAPYQRFIERKIRGHFKHLEGCPILLKFKPRSEQEKR